MLDLCYKPTNPKLQVERLSSTTPVDVSKKIEDISEEVKNFCLNPHYSYPTFNLP